MADERKRIIKAFQEDLMAAYVCAGIRSYGDLAKRLKKIAGESRPSQSVHVSRTTAHSLLVGDRKKLPFWDQVAQLLRAFHAEAATRGIDPVQIGSLEKWKAKHEAAAAALRALDAPALSLASGSPTTGPSVPALESGESQAWYRDYADLVPGWVECYLNHEPLSSRISCYEKAYVPGLLQTRPYATELMRHALGNEPEIQIVRRVELRMMRQLHLLRAIGTPRLWAIINEGALRDGPVSPPTMRAQLRHLRSLGKHIKIQILRASHPLHDAAGGPITILRFEVPPIPDLIFLEHADSAIYPSGDDDQEHYLREFHKYSIAALLPSDSQEFLRRLESQL
ncbi:DUF5753 domain-containing protein [Actinomadura fulvescens]|uniref:DUF5753 domain-containing protein n=1 Tax=Actinomadura fulvescens TaxID=46160 RepID=A0ABP6CN27_9ACTN